MKINTVALLVALIFTTFTSKAQLNIDNCQTKARKNYPLIKQFELIEHSKNMNIANANKMYLPQISISAIGSIINGMPEEVKLDQASIQNGITDIINNLMSGNPLFPTKTANNTETKLIGIVQANQVVWDGGMITAQKKIAKAAAESEKQQLEVSLFAIREQVNQLFFGALLIDEQLKQLYILEETLNKNLQRAKTALNNGVAYQSDVDDLQVELLNLEQNRSQLQAGKKSYIEMLSYLINEPIDIATTLEKPVIKNIETNPSILRPELKLFEEQRNLFNAQNSSLTAGIMPKVGIMGYGVFMTPALSIINTEINHLLMAGVSLSWSIGNLYTLGSNRNKIKNNLLQVDIQEETFRFNTNMKVKQQNNEIEKSKKLLETDNEIIRLRHNSKNSAENKYENGVCTMTELIRKINDESLARQNKALHEIQYLLNIYNYNTTLNN